MSAAENKRLMQHVFSEIAKGNGGPFVESLADDVRWTLTGTTKWSKVYEGKQAVLDLLGALRAKFARPYKATAHRFIADGDHVVVEARGDVITKSGIAYNNSYCFVCRVSDGKLRELTEYFDTELVTAALGDPAET